jgi:hypothetical protein
MIEHPMLTRVRFAVRLLMAVVLGLLVRALVTDPANASQAANQFLFADWLVMKGLDLLLNKLQVASFFNTDYNKEFTREFAVGETVRVKLPQRFIIRDGLGYSPQPIQRINTTVNCNQIFGVDFEWDSAEKALKAERGEAAIQKEYLEPAMAQIAQELDSRCAQWAYQNTNNIVGVLGTDPTALQTINQARQRMFELACPPAPEKGLMIPPQVSTALVNAAVGYFNPQGDLAKQYREGMLGRINGFQVYESMSLYSHTAGTWAGAVTVNGAGQSGSTLTVTATGGDTFKKGDVISIGSVFPVNPMTRRKSSSTTKQFVITQDLTAVGGGTDVLQISPAIFLPGSQYQNVDAGPANTAALTLFPGTGSPNGKSGYQGLALHNDAFALVGVPLEVPKAAEIARQQRDPETGLAIRFVRMFDPQQSKMINRFDVLCGFGNLYSDSCAVRLLCA